MVRPLRMPLRNEAPPVASGTGMTWVICRQPVHTPGKVSGTAPNPATSFFPAGPYSPVAATRHQLASSLRSLQSLTLTARARCASAPASLRVPFQRAPRAFPPRLGCVPGPFPCPSVGPS